MAKRPSTDFNRPRLFSPSALSRTLVESNSVLRKDGQDLVDSNVASTASFRYDPDGTGIRSTQQFDVDFSSFASHTFFSSAEVNVNVAFERVINEFPFDGTRMELEAFLDSLTGFEKWVFDGFPRNVGYLNFSGSSGPSPLEGSYIVVHDFAGYLYPSISKKRTGETVIDPVLRPFTVEMQLAVPAVPNGNQVLLQKLSGSTEGLTLALSQSASTTECDILFAVSSGTLMLSASAPILKGGFHHIVATLDRRPGMNNVQLYIDEALVATSSVVAELGAISFQASPLVIGSGTLHERAQSIIPSVPFVPSQTLSGSIDELRIFHDIRSVRDQQLFAKKSIFASPTLRLYMRFNEPSGSIGTDPLVLDSSGNSLHSLVSNFSPGLRATGSLPSPLAYERLAFQPVLFPAFGPVQDFNVALLASASAYDAQNPNLVTRLVPGHYFEEGQAFAGLSTEEGGVIDPIEGAGPPGTLALGSSQLLSSFLYVWARFFDEIKMALDSFSRVIHVDYNSPGFIADQFLPFLARYYGFQMPAFFGGSSIGQFIDAENIQDSISTNELPLRFVQNQIWRRILTNVGEVIRSKGTLHSIKVLFRSMGIDPDQSFRIREYGGPTTQNLSNARDRRTRVMTLLDFSGSLERVSNPSAVDGRGFNPSRPHLMSHFLSASRVEPGFPPIHGHLVAVSTGLSASDDPSDGLLTSGSWTYEALYRYPTLGSGSHAVTQSLARLHATGSSLGGSGGLIANLTAVSGSFITLYVGSAFGAASGPVLTLPVDGTDIMDGRLWNVSFGRFRGDEVGAFVSASYFVRVARQEFGDLVEMHSASVGFVESGSLTGSQNAFEVIDPAWNASGSFIVVGSQSLDQPNRFLNSSSVGSQARATMFTGRIGQVRFWSKGLTQDEWLEHVRNPRSLGVDDPTLGFNFVVRETGSFGRLRLDASAEQAVSQSAPDGGFMLFDYSQNDLHLTGSGFDPDASLLVPQRVFFSQLSPRFDEASSTEKVRVRSFQDFDNVLLLGGAVAPVYEVPRSEMPNDDVRFSIDLSIADALDEDIVRIFSTFDELDNALGSPELVFSPDYPTLEKLRTVYFNRLTDRVRLRQLFEFFKWFDSLFGISTMVEQLLPRKTRFLGTNFVVESHMLERPRVEYLYSGIYLGEDVRHGLKGDILLQEFDVSVRRF